MQITTKGIVIRARNMGDDRLVTLLTPDCGVVSAIARNANKPRGKLTSSTELFCYSSMVLFRYRESTTVDSADVDTSFFELRNDLEGLALASYFAELCCELAPKEEAAEEYLRLLLNSLHYIKRRTKPLSQLKAIFELRILTLSGFMPDLTGCSICGEFESEKMFFALSSGELFCSKCGHGEVEAQPVSQSVLAAMRHILYSDSKRLFSFSLAQESLSALGRICESYLLCHLQRTYSSLTFYHSVATNGGL